MSMPSINTPFAIFALLIFTNANIVDINSPKIIIMPIIIDITIYFFLTTCLFFGFF